MSLSKERLFVNSFKLKLNWVYIHFFVYDQWKWPFDDVVKRKRVEAVEIWRECVGLEIFSQKIQSKILFFNMLYH